MFDRIGLSGVTAGEDRRHRASHGMRHQGEPSVRTVDAKLCDEDVEFIRSETQRLAPVVGEGVDDIAATSPPTLCLAVEPPEMTTGGHPHRVEMIDLAPLSELDTARHALSDKRSGAEPDPASTLHEVEQVPPHDAVQVDDLRQARIDCVAPKPFLPVSPLAK
ncbi:MAG: hypothetical protein AAFX99_25790, partial [Myxococcota bacterium]